MNLETSVIFKKIILASIIIFTVIEGIILYEIKTSSYELVETSYTSIRALSTTENTEFCFLKNENNDVTKVILNINDDQITGTMDWVPFEKDSARGKLTGKLLTNGEMDLLYDYTIEGSHQTETKIMKIADDRLYIKHGELEDKKYNGNLTYKDREKAVYNEIIEPCSPENKETTY